MTYGLIITKKGVSVTGNNNIEDILLSTLYPLPKIKEEGEDSVTFSSAQTSRTYEIIHNLGYKALTWVYVDTAPGSSFRSRVGGDIGTLNADLTLLDDRSVITIRDINTGSTRVYGFYYYVFFDPVEEI